MVLMLHYISLYLNIVTGQSCYTTFPFILLACYQRAALPFHPFPSGHHDLDKLLTLPHLKSTSDIKGIKICHVQNSK